MATKINHPNGSRLAKIALIEQKLREAGVLGAKAAYVLSDDTGTDDEIEVKIAGVAASVSMQVGRGYYGVNRYFFVDGEIDGAEHLYIGRNFEKAADRLVSAINA